MGKLKLSAMIGIVPGMKEKEEESKGDPRGDERVGNNFKRSAVHTFLGNTMKFELENMKELK